MTMPYGQCLDCRHLRRNPETGRPTWSCAAFPRRIPDAVLFNEVLHDRPIDGDHGVRFEPAEIANGPYARRFRAGVPFDGPDPADPPDPAPG